MEAERKEQQEIIDQAEPLSEEELLEKEELQKQGFEDWSKRDYQQLIKAYEAHGRDASAELLAGEITGQDLASVLKYTKVFWKRWKELEDWERIESRIVEGQAKREKQNNLEDLLQRKICSVRYPMQELDLNYPSTKGKIYSEEEDRYLLVRLAYYGLGADDVYERIKKDITEFPVFRFDWFFKSRTPQELSRRANTLLGMIAKEDEERQTHQQQKTSRAKKRTFEEVQKSEKVSRSSTPTAAEAKKAAKQQSKKKKVA